FNDNSFLNFVKSFIMVVPVDAQIGSLLASPVYDQRIFHYLDGHSPATGGDAQRTVPGPSYSWPYGKALRGRTAVVGRSAAYGAGCRVLARRQPRGMRPL